MKIPQTEFEFSFSRSSGAGGQNVNKVNTKVTLTWDINSSESLSSFVKKRFVEKYNNFLTSDGSVMVISQRYRSQGRNIADAIEKLHEMLESVKKPPKRRMATKPTRGSIKRRVDNKKSKSAVKNNRKKVDY